MSDILLNYFSNWFTLECFLNEVNFKPETAADAENLKDVLKKLSCIAITFDFDFKGPFRSYVDKRYTYEQLLFLCQYKLSESKLPKFEGHMLRSKLSITSLEKFLNYPTRELETKLNSFENLSISYFLSRNPDDDGVQWRRFHSIVGCSVMKYLLIYSYMFRHVRTSRDIYVQISGIKLNTNYKSLVAKYLEDIQKRKKKQTQQQPNTKKKILLPKTPILTRTQVAVAAAQNKENQQPVSGADRNQLAISKKTKLKSLKTIFDELDEKYEHEVIDRKSSTYQLNQLGHKYINKTKMLFDRNLGCKISPEYIYSDSKQYQPNPATANMIIEKFIFKDINFELYPKERAADLIQMKSILNKAIIRFIVNYRSCPFNKFCHYFCKRNHRIKQQKQQQQNKQNEPSEEEVIGSSSNGSSSSRGVKRKRGRKQMAKPKKNEQKKPPVAVGVELKDHIRNKQVYAFLRRTLMYTLGYNLDETNADCQHSLLGDYKNFNHLMRNFRQILSGLKYDLTSLNRLMNGLKMANINYLKPIKCDRYKRLILMGVVRWLFEDYAFMIIRAWFYVTDTCKTNSELFFYHKSDWKEIVNTQLSDPIAKNYSKVYNLEKITEKHVIDYCSRYESNGMHLGRLLPKNVENECRVISGSRVYNPCQKKVVNINFRFITLNNCLKWLIKTDPTLIGFSTNGHKEIYKKYSKFLGLNSFNRYLDIESHEEPLKKWNFIKFDLAKCFDSVNINELISYISDLFRTYLSYENVFTLLRFCSIKYESDKKQLKAKYDFLTIKHHLHEKGFLNGIADYLRVLEESINSTSKSTTNMTSMFNNNKSSRRTFKHGNGIIFVPISIHDRNINCNKLNEALRKCMNHVVIKIHSDIYERTNGVLQGSVCSRNLCDLYLGRIERKLFYFEDAVVRGGASGSSRNPSSQLTIDGRVIEIPMRLNRANEILLRIVDDYLVICSDAARLLEIKSLLNTQVKLNENKTVARYWTKPSEEGAATECSLLKKKRELSDTYKKSIDLEDLRSADSIAASEFSWLSNCSFNFFTWCGFNFDVYTLDIYSNYDKYFDYESLKNRLNNTSDCRFAYYSFNLKFMRLFNSLSTHLLIETRTNSLQSVLRNFADFFALSAIRFTLMSSQMPQQLISNNHLQVKLILNLCHLSNNKLSFYIRQQLLIYFYSTFSLFKFICLRVYATLFIRFNLSKHMRLLKLLNIHLKKLNFIRCIKYNEEFYLAQLIDLIDLQLEKFIENCILNQKIKK